jgi:integrase
VTANRAHTALAGLFKWAIKSGYVTGVNPTDSIDPLIEHSRKRVLLEDELTVIGQEAGNDDFGRATKLLMLTGCRRQEIGGLLWDEINFDKRQIELPDVRTKNGLPHIVPLSEPALAILRECEVERHEGRRHVFGGGDGFTSWYYGKQQLDKRIEARLGAALPHWVLHDIRRSVVTGLSESRERRVKRGHLEEIETYSFALPHVVEAIVNHVSGSKAGVAGIYNKAAYYAEKRQALKLWGEHLTGLGAFAVPASQSEATDQSDDLASQVV